MSRKLPPLEKLLVSKNGRSTSYLRSGAFVAIGIYLLWSTWWRYNHGITENWQWNLLLGFCSFFVVNYRKLVYVSPNGFVKETHTWITHYREELKWNEIKFITIMYRRDEAMVFLEQDVLGWKLLFDKDQIPAMKNLLAVHAPKIEINEMQRND